jgi:hypothetical protein
MQTMASAVDHGVDHGVDRGRRLCAVAEQSTAEAVEWRQRAWQLLGQARVSRAAGDAQGYRRLLDEIRRLRARAAKAGAFARLCRGRAARPAMADDAGEA